MKKRSIHDTTKACHCRHHDVRLEDLKHVCKLGIDIRAHVGGSDFGWLRRAPCYSPNASEPDHVPCSRFERFTDEELTAHRDEMERATQAMLKKMAVVAQVKRERKGGEFPCPACGGTLTIAIASNGHTMGRCTGKDCPSWIE